MEAKHIAKKLELSDRKEHLARNDAFILLKDHKKRFSLKLPCCLITFKERAWENKQTKTGKNQQSKGTSSRRKPMEKLKKRYKIMVHYIR